MVLKWRTCIAILVLCGHVALVLVLLADRVDEKRAVQVPESILISISDTNLAEPSEVALPQEDAPWHLALPPPTDLPIDAQEIEGIQVREQPWVDWERQASEAASRIAGEDSAYMVGADRRRLPADAAPKEPNFRWSRTATDRLGTTEDGMTYFRLNDRCVLVNFLLPGCVIGKIEPKGDLFKDMKRVDPEDHQR